MATYLLMILNVWLLRALPWPQKQKQRMVVCWYCLYRPFRMRTVFALLIPSELKLSRSPKISYLKTWAQPGFWGHLSLAPSIKPGVWGSFPLFWQMYPTWAKTERNPVVYDFHSQSKSPIAARTIPNVMTNTDRTTFGEGTSFFKIRTLRTNETIGVHLLMAANMGMFIPCKANKFSAEWSTGITTSINFFLHSKFISTYYVSVFTILGPKTTCFCDHTCVKGKTEAGTQKILSFNPRPGGTG